MCSIRGGRKKIAVWAPTFRGNAAQPYLIGLSDIQRAAAALGDDWQLLIKAHPHIDAHGQVSNCTIPTEELFAVADVLITDYSSVMFDYLLYKSRLCCFLRILRSMRQSGAFIWITGACRFRLWRMAGRLPERLREARHTPKRTDRAGGLLSDLYRSVRRKGDRADFEADRIDMLRNLQ